MFRFARPVVPIAGDAAIIAERVVERSALESQIVGFGLAHRIREREAGDIGLAARGHQFDLAVEQFLLGVEHVEDGASADAIFGARAFERQLVGLHRDLAGSDDIERGMISGESGPGIGHHQALGGDALLERLALERLRLADSRGGKPALIERDACFARRCWWQCRSAECRRYRPIACWHSRPKRPPRGSAGGCRGSTAHHSPRPRPGA